MTPADCRSLRRLAGLFLSLAILNPGNAEPGDPALRWPASNQECRPWAYNWWLGSAVDTNNLARELRRYHDAGMGGIHVIPIYGAKGAEPRYLDYLGPAWFEMFQFCLEEAGRLGLGIDLTTGSGWCFGGPNVPKTDGGWTLRTSGLEIAAGQTPTNRWVPDSLVALVAVTADHRQLDLRDRLRPDGSLDWTADAPGTRLYAVTAAPEGRMVKRAAPGGAGPMINPFSHRAMTNYLARFTSAFASYRGPLPRAMYHDSYEYNSNWTPDLLDAFARFRGYRLEEHWPEFCQDPRSNEFTARLRADYQETLSDLMVEAVFPEWIRWCQARGIRTRNQAHGSPANLLDLYALADIPETEMFGRGTRDPLRSRFDERFGEGDRDPLISKFASSAAHTSGRKLVAAETGTWMAEHFCETLEELKCLVDLLFVSGVNHVIYHGTCYSPDDAAWPGWLFYASTQMNPRNAIWRDAPILNAYLERCQSLLQSGQPDNEVLLYWPLHELWQTAPGLITQLGVHRHEWLTGQPVGLTARHLWNRGYGFDYVSDRQLAPADVTDTGRVRLPGADYAVVLVPRTRWMPVDTLRRLIELAERGGTILFEGQLPQDVPGAAMLAERQAGMKRLLASLNFPVAATPFRQATVGRGRMLVGELEAMLGAARVPRETICDEPGVRFIRRRIDEGHITFIANQGIRLVDRWVPLAIPARSVVLMDALTGRTGLAETRTRTNGGREVRLRLEPGHSIFLRTLEQRVAAGPAWWWPMAGGETVALGEPWQIEFIAGGPVLPKARRMATPRSWTDSGDSEAERFGGTAVYRTEFEAPAGDGPWILDLGDVRHSARVRLNGAEVGRLILPPYRLELPALRPGRNELEIEVTNLSANRLRDLDRRKVPWRVFHDINLVNTQYQPFDASNWPVMGSGLLGPVVVGRMVRLTNATDSHVATLEAAAPTYTIVIAHRGDHTAAHENSLVAIEQAIRAGADYVELDVRATRDGELVLMHDGTVDRMTDGQGRIADLSWAEVQRLALVDRQRTNLPPAKVPSLAEALGVLQGRAGLYLDFKSGDRGQVVRLLRRYQMVASTVVYDDREAMERWKELEPALRTMTSPEPEDLSIDTLSTLKQRLRIDILDGPASVYTPTWVREIQQRGLPVWPDIQGPWENPRFWDQVVSLQAAGYQTDRPADFIDFLRQRGYREVLERDRVHRHLGGLLDELGRRGYAFSRVDEMLADQPPRRPAFLRLNQLGYRPGDVKRAVAFSAGFLGDAFQVVDPDSGQIVFDGPVRTLSGGGWGRFESHGELDFTALTRPGRYRLRVDGTESGPFQVREAVWRGLPAQMLGFLRQQRCGYNPWLDVECHQADGRTAFGPHAPGTRLDARGGWHDAADLLKYLLTSGNATAQMLLAWELHRPTARARDSNLREQLFPDLVDARGKAGTNGIPDVLDEARWGLEWMLKLHPTSEDLYHQVADDRDHYGLRLPHQDQADYGWGRGGDRVVYCADGRPQGLGRFPSDSSGLANLAGRYAAAMALAWQIWKDDPVQAEFAQRCLQAGREVYALGRRMEGVQQGNSYGAPYRYAESTWTDDMEWGAVELFRATGESHYLAEASQYARLAAATSWMGREQTGHYEFYPFFNAGHYRLHGVADAELRAQLAEFYREGLDRCAAVARHNPYGIGVPFIWCSNNLLVALVTQAQLYQSMTGDRRYEELTARHRDWLFGRNPWGTTMFTGVGGRYPTDVHLMTTRLTRRQIPGGLVDGPVKESIFTSLKGVTLSQPDGFAAFQDTRAVYHDDWHDYASNEPTMDGTASAVLMLSVLEGTVGATD